MLEKSPFLLVKSPLTGVLSGPVLVASPFFFMTGITGSSEPGQQLGTTDAMAAVVVGGRSINKTHGDYIFQHPVHIYIYII